MANENEQTKPRKAYTPPGVSATVRFETLAMDCGKASNDGSGGRGRLACRGRGIGNS